MNVYNCSRLSPDTMHSIIIWLDVLYSCNALYILRYCFTYSCGIIHGGRKLLLPVAKWRGTPGIRLCPDSNWNWHSRRSSSICTGARDACKYTTHAMCCWAGHGWPRCHWVCHVDDTYTLYIMYIVYYIIVFELPFFAINICV